MGKFEKQNAIELVDNQYSGLEQELFKILRLGRTDREPGCELNSHRRARVSDALTMGVRHIVIGNGLVLPAAHAKFGMVKTLS